MNSTWNGVHHIFWKKKTYGCVKKKTYGCEQFEKKNMVIMVEFYLSDEICVLHVFGQGFCLFKSLNTQIPLVLEPSFSQWNELMTWNAGNVSHNFETKAYGYQHCSGSSHGESRRDPRGWWNDDETMIFFDHVGGKAHVFLCRFFGLVTRYPLQRNVCGLGLTIESAHGICPFWAPDP